MKTFQFIPECLKGEDSTLKGHLVLKMPGGDAMFDLIDVQEKLQQSQKEGVRSMLEWSYPFIEGVDVKHLDGSEFKSLQDLKDDIRCFKILSEVAAFLAHLADGKQQA